MAGYQYFKFYKPFGMLSQFTDEGGHSGIGSLNIFPPNIYPVGRLDHDSEGLLLLTDNPAVNKALLDPKNQHARTYWVQVEGNITSDALARLAKGLSIRINKKDYITKPAIVEKITIDDPLPDRNPPIRYRASIPTSWICLTITEGKNRQVRRMTAAAGFPTLRLVRMSIEKLNLDNLTPGESLEVSEAHFLRDLRLKLKPDYNKNSRSHSPIVKNWGSDSR